MQIAQSWPTRAEKDLWSMGVLPVMVLGALSSLIGVYWDIAWHVDIGRDTFFTMPHNFIYSGMLIVLLTSAWGLVVDRRETAFHWRAGRRTFHPGILMATVAAGLILFFAPADELWHRFFGVDATLWGPMHLVGLTGFALFCFAGVVTTWLERGVVEVKRQRLFERVTLFFVALLLGNLMLFLAEYEFNIAQFPVDFHPLLLAGLSAFPLVLIAKLHPRSWAATKVALLFTALRLIMHFWLEVTNGMGLAGASKPVFPVLILTALVVDASVQRLPIWLVGALAGASTIAVNLIVTLSFPQMQWTLPVLLRGGSSGILLAVVLALLGAYVARVLRVREARA
jgi:hypothetical protein